MDFWGRKVVGPERPEPIDILLGIVFMVLLPALITIVTPSSRASLASGFPEDVAGSMRLRRGEYDYPSYGELKDALVNRGKADFARWFGRWKEMHEAGEELFVR